MALVSLADMKDYLEIAVPTWDQFLTDNIQIVSDAIEGYCGRKFLQATYTHTFESQDFEAKSTGRLYSFHYPIISVTSAKEIEQLADGSTNEYVLDALEYQLEKRKGQFTRTDKCNRRKSWFNEFGAFSRVELVYDAGFATTPTPIEDVVFSLVAERYNKFINNIELNFGRDVQRISIPGVMSIDFDYTLQTNERKNRFAMILGSFMNVLDPYRSERVLIGEIQDNYVQ